MGPTPHLPEGLHRQLARLFPGAVVEGVEWLAPDSGATAGMISTAKVAGYGRPVRVGLRVAGRRRDLVFHTASPDRFGHDRRADRAAEALLAFDTFHEIPRQVESVDVGAILPDGELQSLRTSSEFYLITDYAPGTPYAEDLRRVATSGRASPSDLERVQVLARYLASLHAQKRQSEGVYRRSVRDLIGHGEGIFGMVDAFPDETPGVSPGQLERIESACLSWRWRLRRHEHRLSRIHGDFHPFNILFEEGSARFSLLDASRGCLGDPADDVAALAINFLFFSLDGTKASPLPWREGLGALWHRFFGVYAEASRDSELSQVIAPYLAWRLLVVTHPVFYPALSPRSRERLLAFAERRLVEKSFSPGAAGEELFP